MSSGFSPTVSVLESCNIFKGKKRALVITVTIVLCVAAFLVLLISNVFAATSLKIIQQKEDPSKPVIKSMYVGETVDIDVLINGNPNGGGSQNFTWSVSPSTLATISSEGVIVANTKLL